MTKPRWIKTQAQVQLERREIAKRYRKRGKPSLRGAWLAAIRIAELTRWLDLTNGAGTELDPDDKASETIIRVFVHHLVVLKDGTRRASDWLMLYAPWLTLRSREALISEAAHCTIHWTADRLAWKLGIRDAIRTELEFTTIGAIDCSKEQRAKRRKAMQAAAQRTLRAKRKAASPP